MRATAGAPEQHAMGIYDDSFFFILLRWAVVYSELANTQNFDCRGGARLRSDRGRAIKSIGDQLTLVIKIVSLCTR